MSYFSFPYSSHQTFFAHKYTSYSGKLDELALKEVYDLFNLFTLTTLMVLFMTWIVLIYDISGSIGILEAMLKYIDRDAKYQKYFTVKHCTGAIKSPHQVNQAVNQTLPVSLIRFTVSLL